MQGFVICSCCRCFYLMDWINKIGRIVCLNLSHREDRLLVFTEMMEKYEIPFDRVEAIYNKEKGAEGLRDTMIKLFTEEIEKGNESILVFEDDAEIIIQPPLFHGAMTKIMQQLPDNYEMVFLGCQITSNGCTWYSTNLIRVKKAFSTHAVLYSKKGMKEIVSRGLGYPIDNWYVDNLQNNNNSYCTYPFLVSQRDGYSDIGMNFISWKPFLEQRFVQKFGTIKRE